MKIIGHRGASDLALENTLAAIRAAQAAGVDAIEVDAQMTADHQFVVCHDPTTNRVSTTDMVIAEHSFTQLKDITLHNGETFLSLENALLAIATTPAILDMKGSGWAEPLVTLLRSRVHQGTITVIAFDHDELARFHQHMPDIATYALQDFHPIDSLHALQVARSAGFTGVDLNFWLLNPLTYWLAHRWNIEIIVYTVNTPWIARFLSLLFPKISITTDRPNQLQNLRAKAL